MKPLDGTELSFVRFIHAHLRYLIGKLNGYTTVVVHSVVSPCCAGYHAAQVAISFWRPRIVVSLGIAFGNPAFALRLGDVLVSENIHLYVHQPTSADSTPLVSACLRVSPSVIQALRHSAHQWISGTPVVPRVVFGNILSGPVVEIADFHRKIVSSFPSYMHIIGGEMVATGISNAAGTTPFVVIKAIADWDMSAVRADAYAGAAFAAASFLHFAAPTMIDAVEKLPFSEQPPIADDDECVGECVGESATLTDKYLHMNSSADDNADLSSNRNLMPHDVSKDEQQSSVFMIDNVRPNSSALADMSGNRNLTPRDEVFQDENPLKAKRPTKVDYAAAIKAATLFKSDVKGDVNHIATPVASIVSRAINASETKSSLVVDAAEKLQFPEQLSMASDGVAFDLHTALFKSTIARVRQSLVQERAQDAMTKLHVEYPALFHTRAPSNTFEIIYFKWPWPFRSFQSCRPAFEDCLLSEIALSLGLTDAQRQHHLRIEAAFPGSIWIAVGFMAISSTAIGFNATCTATGASVLLITAAVVVQHLRNYVARGNDTASMTLIGQAQILLGATLRPSECSEVLKRPYKRVALFDGGGVKVLLTLSMLRRIEHELQRFAGPNARVGMVFDVMIGTSTGGIIAVCLRRGMAIQEIIDLYLNMAISIFPRGFFHTVVGLWRATGFGWYSAKNLEAICNQHLGGANALNSLSGVGVTTRCLSSQSTRLLYAGCPASGILPIVDALRMTSAAPTYFYPMHWDGHVYVDGGVQANCPAEEFFKRFDVPADSCVFSFGCGYHTQPKIVSHSLLAVLLANDLVQSATETNSSSSRAAVMAQTRNIQYLRFSPQIDNVFDDSIQLDCTDPATLHNLANHDWFTEPNSTPHDFAQLRANLLA